MKTYILIILAMLTALTTACNTPMPMAGESYLEAYKRGIQYKPYYRATYGMHYRAPAIPSNASFLYRPPIGWEGNNPRSFRLENKTDNLHGRCWLDGREVLPSAYGRIPQGPVTTASGIKMVPLLPPGANTYIVLPDAGPHHIKCQLYAGPAPFVLVYEATDPTFRPNGYANGTFRLHPDWMTRVSRLD